MYRATRFLRHAVQTAAAIAAAVAHAAFQPPDGIVLEPNGTLRVADAEILFEAAAPDWRFHSNGRWESVECEENDDTFCLRARFDFGAEHDSAPVPCEVSEKLRRTGPETLRVETRWRFEHPVRANAVFAGLHLKFPMAGDVLVDDRTFPVPAAHMTPSLRLAAPARSLSVTLRGGWVLEIDGDLSLQLQDNRFWNGDTMTARLHAAQSDGDAEDAVVAFNLRISPPGALPIPLAGGENARAEIAGARTARPRRTPHVKFAEDAELDVPQHLDILGFPFELAQPPLALAHEALFHAEIAGTTALEEDKENPPAALVLLHAADWTRQAGNLFPRGAVVGRVRVEWADGRDPDIVEIGAENDVGHFADAGASFPNAAPVWISEDAAVTLYASCFPLPGTAPGRRVSRLVFEAAHPAAAWIVAAATLAARPVAFPSSAGGARVMAEGPRWARLDWRRETHKDGAFDFSFVADALAPAGKDGFVVATPDGFLSFERAPEKRVRLHGVNLGGSGLDLSHDESDRLVETLRRAGYNSLRIHHHDRWLVGDAGVFPSENSLSLDSARLDRLDYLISACKRGGLYVTTNLYVNRRFVPGDGIDCSDDPETLRNVKGLLPVSEKARDNLKTFARSWLLDHVNPYTGLPLVHDPVLATLSLVNEETLELAWGRSAELVPRYRARFAKWKASKGLPADDERSFGEFLNEMECDLFRDLASFAKDELGVRCPVVTTASPYGAVNAEERAIGDAVDLHGYFAHPQFPMKPWSHPIRTSLRSPIREEAQLPRDLFANRVAGKPLTVSEISYCYPAPHRMQGAPILGAYAAMQGWSALWRFIWSHNRERVVGLEPPVVFDAAVDPYQQLGDRIVAALFARGDMAASTNRLSWAVRPGGGDFPASLSMAGLRAAVGCHLAGTPLPAGVREWTPVEGLPPPDPRLRLDTEAGTFAAVTPCTEALALERGDLEGDALRVEGADRECVVAAIARDALPLRESADIVLLHLTDLSATGMRWESDNVFGNWGGFPLLVARGTARISIATDGPRRVEALNADGEPVGEIDATFSDGRVSFLADVAAFPCGIAGYRLTVDPETGASEESALFRVSGTSAPS